MCPICKISQKNFARHLATHDLSKEEKETLCYKNRKRRLAIKKNRTVNKCPFDLCANLPGHGRLDIHLRRVHKLRFDDPKYKELIKSKTNNNNQTKNKK